MAGNVSEKRRQMMLEWDTKKLLGSMAIPPIISQLIGKIYNLVDAYFVSTLGTAATAGVGVNGSLEHTITMVGGLLGAGACSYIARLLGEKRNLDADRVLSTSFFTGIGFGCIVAIFGTIFIHPLMSLFCSNAESLPYAIEYGTYVLLAAPFMIGSFILTMCLRSEGASTLAMVGTMVGGVLNCFLDPLFIYTFDMGVTGASIATAISKVVSFMILLWPYLKKNCSVQIAIRKVKFVLLDFKEVVSIGSTSLLRSLCNIICSVLINRIAGTFSTAALAAISLANRVMEFPFAIILGFSQGCQPVIGFNWGAKRLDRVHDCLKVSSIIAIVGSLVFSAILFAAANPVIQIFNKQADLEVLRLGAMCIRLQCITLVFHGFDSVINAFYSGTGQAKFALLMSTARQGYCFLPTILTLPFLFGAEGIVACQATADLLALAVVLPLAIKAFKSVRQTEALE